MDWIFLSFLAAFGQAFGWALKKKTLENKGVNNTLVAVSFFSAGIILVIMWGVQSDWIVPAMTERFILATMIVIVLNIVAAWAGYRALNKAALSTLMPFIALTSLAIVPVEYLLRGILPSPLQIVGMVVVIAGAILFAAKKLPGKEALAAAGYFAVTLLCYSVTAPFMAVAVEESGSGLFSATVFHLGIAVGFIPLMVRAKESGVVSMLRTNGEWKKILWLMIATGGVIALLENGPATIALETAKASEVFAIKRVMPFFALILGIIMFGEKVTRRHIAGTALLVLGSMCIIWFR